ncbi:unnamed protein product [Sphagnum tenellum]
MRFIAVSAIVASIASVVSATACNSTDSSYNGISAPIVQTFSDNTIIANMTISGTVSIVDGCNFAVKNFTYLPGSNDTVWYGRLNGNYTVGKQASPVVFTRFNNSDVLFTFTNGVSWNDMDSLVLYSNSLSMQMAYASFNLPRPTTSTTASTSATSTATTGSTVSATATSSTTSTSVPDQSSGASVNMRMVTADAYLMGIVMSFALTFIML